MAGIRWIGRDEETRCGFLRSRWRERMRGAAMLAALGLALGWGGQAHALAYFTGPEGFGFDNPSVVLAPEFVVLSIEDFSPAGSRELDDDGEFALAFRSKQDVKRKGKGHFRIKVEWTVKNKTESKLDEVMLLLTALGGPDTGFPQFPDYSGVPIDLKLKSAKPDPFRILHYDNGLDDFFFAGFLLKNMKPGNKGKTKLKFKYDVFREGGLIDRTPPALGVAALIDPTPVPEPSTFMLLGVGAAGITGWSRRRRA